MRGSLAAFIVLLGGLTFATASQASLVDLSFQLDLNGMSSGASCPSGVCGSVTIVGDTTSSLIYTINLASGVSFHANHTGNSGTGDFLYFQLTDPGGNPITFSNISPGGTIGGKSYSYNPPTLGSFAPNAGNFPGPYDFEMTCTNSTAGKICAGPLTFTANGATAAHPFVIGSPVGHGLFAADSIAIVADLSVSGDCLSACGAGTGDVGTTLLLSSTPPVPEPSTWAMMIIGFLGLGFMAYRRTHSAPRFA
jgi:PEP-CTERM motif